jgi:signal transduction histidine kinase
VPRREFVRILDRPGVLEVRMTPRRQSLKRTLSAALIALASVTAVASASQVVFVSLLDRTTVKLSAALESMRMAEDAERNVLLLERSNDPVIRDELAAELKRDLLDARAIGSPNDIAALDRAEADVARYLEAPHGSAAGAEAHASAHATLTALVHRKLVRAREAEASAQRWTEIAHAIGIAVAVLVVVAAGVMVWWIQARALRPLFGLAGAMKRFARGDVGQRADEGGPEELGAMAGRFNEMADAIERQRELHRAFVGAAAHDIRTPLSALRLASDLLGGDAPLPDEARTRRIFGTVRREVDAIERLVRDLLDTSSLEAGHLDLQTEPHDLRDVASFVARVHEGTSPGHRIEVTVPDTPVVVISDVLRMEQVISNLVSNAIKYSPRGGRVGIEITAEGETIAIAVSDEGVGMTQREIDDAFEPFKRASKTKNEVRGHGLGLFLVKRIVTAHGGTIAVESTPARGSRFTVTLPASPPADARDDASPTMH